MRYRARYLALVLIVGLTGCMAKPRPEGVRNPQATISSQVDVTAARLAGDWVVRASWSDVARPGERLHLRAGLGGELWLDDMALPARGKGRFGGSGGIPEWWVLWLDADNRTAAIGTPGGDFGWIMDRRAEGGADRIRAAKDIMDWMGYDMARARE